MIFLLAFLPFTDYLIPEDTHRVAVALINPDAVVGNVAFELIAQQICDR